MIRCLAIDDEPLALKQLVSYIMQTPFLELVAACQSAVEAKEILHNEQIDALFVDINMPDLNGLDFVKSLSTPLLVVFTTAYSEFALEGYKVNAIDYLLKPFGLDDFIRAAQKVKKQYELMNAVSVSVVDMDDAIFFKTEYKIVRVDIKQIMYVESMSEYLKIHLVDEPKPIIVLLSMKKIEERLPVNSFMRVHRSYIINLKMIKEVNKSRIIMNSDTYIPIGDNYREAFNNYLNTKFLTK
ncbi:MAG: response regulator transcription factor [Phocaeicola sp.]|nr:response regulator transcription factor [Phocaeicola sp.]